MYFSIDIPRTEISDMNSLDEYFFKYNVENFHDIYGIWDEENNGFIIMGYTPLDFLDGIEILIFNCATKIVNIKKAI